MIFCLVMDFITRGFLEAWEGVLNHLNDSNYFSVSWLLDRTQTFGTAQKKFSNFLSAQHENVLDLSQKGALCKICLRFNETLCLAQNKIFYEEEFLFLLNECESVLFGKPCFKRWQNNVPSFPNGKGKIGDVCEISVHLNSFVNSLKKKRQQLCVILFTTFFLTHSFSGIVSASSVWGQYWL